MRLALLRAFHAVLGVHECYVADLDAIQGRALQRTLIRHLAEFHTGFAGALLVDAGTSRPGGALEVLSCGAASRRRPGNPQAFADLAASSRWSVHRGWCSASTSDWAPDPSSAMQDASGVVRMP